MKFSVCGNGGDGAVELVDGNRLCRAFYRGGECEGAANILLGYSHGHCFRPGLSDPLRRFQGGAARPECQCRHEEERYHAYEDLSNFLIHGGTPFVVATRLHVNGKHHGFSLCHRALWQEGHWGKLSTLPRGSGIQAIPHYWATSGVPGQCGT